MVMVLENGDIDILFGTRNCLRWFQQAEGSKGFTGIASLGRLRKCGLGGYSEFMLGAAWLQRAGAGMSRNTFFGCTGSIGNTGTGYPTTNDTGTTTDKATGKTTGGGGGTGETASSKGRSAFTSAGPDEIEAFFGAEVLR